MNMNKALHHPLGKDMEKVGSSKVERSRTTDFDLHKSALKKRHKMTESVVK